MIRGYFDGASRGNPGQAGAGAVIYDGSRIIWRCARPLGIKTNNEAEYAAIGILTDELLRRGIKKPEICGDSKLVISQVTGAWKIREPRLAALAVPIKEKVKAMGAVCRWVPREKNAEADRLSNVALDEGDLLEDLENSVAADLAQPDGKVLQKEIGQSQSVPETVPEQKMRFRRVWGKIWLVADGDDVFAVDLSHCCCTCAQGRARGRCRHVDALMAEIAALKG